MPTSTTPNDAVCRAVTAEQRRHNRSWQSVRFNYVESEPVQKIRGGALVWVTYYAEPWPERKTVVAQLLEYRCNNTLPCSDRFCSESGHWH
jgi:hypothetical protein